MIRDAFMAIVLAALFMLAHWASDQAEHVGAPDSSAPRAWTED